MKSKQDQINQRFLLEDADKNERKARFSEELPLFSAETECMKWKKLQGERNSPGQQDLPLEGRKKRFWPEA